jgi:RimJ/RimL family protein N-acetyltransferase
MRSPNTKSSWVEPVTLAGRAVRLEPLGGAHLEGLCEIGLDEALWRWTLGHVRTREEMRAYLEVALNGRTEGTTLPFAILAQPGGQVVGSTRFGNIDRENRRVEIGWTWIGRRWQRTAVNTEIKYLMLRHAFESLGCVRVEFKTDTLNQTSRRAILRLGAKEEGILRRHMITDGGRIRDTVYYSIIDGEWAEVKARLEAKLAAPA